LTARPSSFGSETAREAKPRKTAVYRFAGKDWEIKGRPLFRLQAGLIWLICFSSAAMPRFLTVLLGVLAVAAAIHVLVIDPKRPLALLRTPVGIALALFTAYLFINASCAPDRGASYAKAATVLGLLAGAFLIAASYSLRSAEDARVLARWALIGLGLGVVYLLIALAFDQPFKRFITNHLVAVFHVSAKKAKIVHGEVIYIRSFVLNRNVTSLVLLLVPGLLFTAAIGKARHVMPVALILASATCVLISQSGTSAVALFLGAAVAGAAAFSLKATRMLLIGTWTVVMLFALPLSALPYELGWAKWTWLPPESVAARFYIWNQMANEAYKTPIGASVSAGHATWT
jgi:hypothetical protein